MDVRRSTHPDLLDELEQQPGPSQPADGLNPVRARRRRNGATAKPEVSPPGDTADTPAAAEGGSGESLAPEPAAPESTETAAATETPEWLSQARSADDPLESLKLLVKHVPRDQMEKDDTLRGWLGDYANQRARRMLEDQERQRADRDRQAAYDRGDLYTLGQLTAAELQTQREMLEQQRQAAANPYMQGITQFQQGLPESVQREVGGRNYDSFQAYLQAVHESAIRHGLEEEVRKREPALRKAELSSTVGSEMAPELDGGPAQAYREITDAQVAAMTLEEYDRYFDEKGRPKPGVRVSLTRGIDVRREQRR
jgi:hypothetical protein